MQALYQLDVQGSSVLAQFGDFFQEYGDDITSRKLAAEWTRGTWDNIETCDELIVGAIIKWKLSRLATVDKSILRLSVFQLKFRPDIPPKVVINEAIELAKKFGTDKSSAFVNGVLDAVLKKITAGQTNEQEKSG
jgi:N utilization substance protein B